MPLVPRPASDHAEFRRIGILFHGELDIGDDRVEVVSARLELQLSIDLSLRCFSCFRAFSEARIRKGKAYVCLLFVDPGTDKERQDLDEEGGN